MQGTGRVDSGCTVVLPQPILTPFGEIRVHVVQPPFVRSLKTYLMSIFFAHVVRVCFEPSIGAKTL